MPPVIASTAAPDPDTVVRATTIKCLFFAESAVRPEEASGQLCTLMQVFQMRSRKSSNRTWTDRVRQCCLILAAAAGSPRQAGETDAT
jgi:hypothetical protein